jgi:hypothetical protein
VEPPGRNEDREEEGMEVIFFFQMLGSLPVSALLLLLARDCWRGWAILQLIISQSIFLQTIELKPSSAC